MKLVVPFKVEEDHYKTEDAVFFCMDARFTRLDKPEKSLLVEMVKVLGFKMPDPVVIAGGAMDFRDTSNDKYKYLLGQALGSWQLHGTKKFHLAVHVNCGAYKLSGLENIAANRKSMLAEVIRIKENLEKDLRANKCDSVVKVYIADFDGLWEVE